MRRQAGSFSALRKVRPLLSPSGQRRRKVCPAATLRPQFGMVALSRCRVPLLCCPWGLRFALSRTAGAHLRHLRRRSAPVLVERKGFSPLRTHSYFPFVLEHERVDVSIRRGTGYNVGPGSYDGTNTVRDGGCGHGRIDKRVAQ